MKTTKELSTNPVYNQIILQCGSIDVFASKMGMTTQGVYKKLKNLKKWSVEDIEKARLVLGINNASEFARIFFDM